VTAIAFRAPECQIIGEKSVHMWKISLEGKFHPALVVYIRLRPAAHRSVPGRSAIHVSGRQVVSKKGLTRTFP
jgi:hypothetical protein